MIFRITSIILCVKDGLHCTLFSVHESGLRRTGLLVPREEGTRQHPFLHTSTIKLCRSISHSLVLQPSLGKHKVVR
jgi:hypothetical protein